MQTPTPLISIIMPVYNAEDWIVPTLNSVKEQTYTHFEVLMMDDGSTDSSLEKIKPYLEDPRFILIQQENQGVSRARNNAFKHAKGEYIAFLDSDDCWFMDKLALDVATIEAAPDKVCLIYSGVYCVDGQNRLTSIRKFVTDHDGQNALKTILSNNLMIPSSTMMHRQVMEDLGGFPTDTYHEDRVFFVRACEKFPAYCTGERSIVYREDLSGRSRKVLADYDRAVKAEYSIIDSLKPDLSPEDFAILENFHRRSIFNRFLRYNFLPYAKRYASQLPHGALDGDLKGLISKLSLALNINIMYFCQVIVYFCAGTLLQPWWYVKSAPLRQRNAL